MRSHATENFAKDFRFLEAPKWRNSRLYVSDVFDLKVYEIDGDGRERRVICDVPNRPAGLAFLPDGALIIVSQADKRLLRWDGTTVSEYADLSAVATGYLNDLAVDSAGRLYVGNFGYDFVGGAPRQTAPLHRVDRDGAIVEVAPNLDFANGAVIINGGRTLVVAETWEKRLTAFDLSPEGALSNRRVFADLGERMPDGICADAEHAIWVGCYNTGEFVRVMDGGEVTDTIQFQGAGISCVLGGADGRTLFMTTFLGADSDMSAGRRLSTVEIARVDVRGAA